MSDKLSLMYNEMRLKAARMDEDDVRDLQNSFLIFDNVGDGKINVAQLGEVLRALGQNPTEAEVKKCCSGLTSEARIDFDTFVPILQTVSKNKPQDTVDDYVEGLRHFDNDGSGFISSVELRHLLTALGEKLDEDDVEQLLAGQEDSQGNVPYEEFVKMVLSG